MRYHEIKREAPVDFADAMIITQEEVDNGEAVLVSDLSNAQISEYWTNYAALNGQIPSLVHKEPTLQNAQVLVGANWTNGWWVVEIQRDLTTPHPDTDVQFDDFEKDYLFTMSGSGGSTGEYSGYIVKFEH